MNAIASRLIDDADLDGIRRDMIRFAHLQLRDKAQAEDAVQEALLAALDNAKGFAGRAAFKTWVFAILKNKIVNLIRRQSRTINISALSAEEESLDQAFEAQFKANAHWAPAARPSDWGDPEADAAPAAILGGIRCLPQAFAGEHRPRLHDARVSRIRDARGLPGIEHHDEQLQRHPASRAQWIAALS